MRKFLVATALLFSSFALAQTIDNATIHLNVSFDVPVTGTPPTAYHFYIDDCAATGAVGAPAAVLTSGTQTLDNLITEYGTYEMCVRSVNPSQETADPGTAVQPVIITQTPPSNPVDNLNIDVTCRDTAGAVAACLDLGIDVTVTVN